MGLWSFYFVLVVFACRRTDGVFRFEPTAAATATPVNTNIATSDACNALGVAIHAAAEAAEKPEVEKREGEQA